MPDEDTPRRQDCLGPHEDESLDETGRLIWELLDGTIGRADSERLDAILATNGEARKKYVDSVMLHFDLTEHFREDVAPDETSRIMPPQSPILGFLGDIVSGDVPGTDPTFQDAD